MGEKDAIFQGCFQIYEAAIKKIDMRHQEGAFPRIGAVDIVPFVAIRQSSLENAIEWAKELGHEIGSRFSLPVYLAGEAATNPLRRELESIRDGEYEGFAAKMQDPAWKPDFGPAVFPADRGATMVSARLPLVNIELYLNTSNEEAAKYVAHVLTGAENGLPDVRLYPGMDRTCGMAIINLTVRNYSATPLYRVFEAIKTELRRFGATIVSAKFIGLVPQSALLDSALHYLQITGFREDDVLETKMEHSYHSKQ
jgi:glutamate formiminotransferase